jgi:hypothetical protein
LGAETAASTRGNYDGRGYMDATIFDMHAKQNTTQRCGRCAKDSTMVQSLCCSAGKVVQEKHIRCFAKVCHPLGRTSYTARHPCGSLRSSCQQQSYRSKSLSSGVLLVNSCRGCKGHCPTM